LAVLAVGGTSVAATAIGIAAVRAGTLPGPALAVLALTPLALADVVAGLPDAAVRLLTAVPAAQRLAELERRPAPVTDPVRPAAGPLAVPSPRTRPAGAAPGEGAEAVPPASLAAHELAVRWPDAVSDAVRDVELDLRAGTRLALTGPSGSGKSSVVAALMRTLAPSAGRVLADGRDARELTGDELRRGIAWCGAWTHLFDSTLRENLRLAAPEAGDAELVDALRRARLGGWFARLPDGLDTLVGRHGGAVSGGERQRIGITRALLADRPILLLDEPTAHLDPGTADALAAEVLTATEGRTALIVTHRPEQVPGVAEVRLGLGAAPERPGPLVRR
ncbi:MAG TPA: ATP-binding cassette domain-containing protein, partial [Pseudonocardia sp.]|nr:ATP-binding cassette domain-containing protein [Pseudonocardia sp.]